MKYDGLIKISIGESRLCTDWKNTEMLWSALAARLMHENHTAETANEYAHMTKARQGQIKDVGGFVGGTLSGGRRKADTILRRSVLTLDIDNATDDPWDTIDLMLGCAAVMYSTHSHTPTHRRYRLVIPLAREVSPDEYAALSRRVAADIGIDMMDDSTYEAHRLMYWPSTPIDGEWVAKPLDAAWLDPDKELARYADWTDASQWPFSSRQDRALRALKDKQADPLAKDGWIGAFCRAYTIPAAIETFLPDVYTPCGDGRYTYTAGSTVGGLVLYDGDAFAYSHHGTDPCGGQLVNAYDLVRLHKFGQQDKDAAPDTPVNRLPSFTAMQALASSDDAARLENARKMFGGDLPEDAENTEWLSRLTTDKRGNFLATIPNIEIILENDPAVAGCLAFDAFRERPTMVRDTTWRSAGDRNDWGDADDANLRSYLEMRYNIVGLSKVADAVTNVMMRHKIHPVRDYLDALPPWDGEPRVDTLMIDWLGVEDSPYTRAVTRKALVGAIKRIYQPGCMNQYTLVLVGDQGTGKSTILRKLGGEWFSDSLLGVSGKDAYEQLIGVWIVEMGELAATRRADNESIKNFLTKQVDNYRSAYGRRTQEHPRQCAFFGTTNDREFIHDDTGGRRFWVIEVDQQPRKYADLWHGFDEAVRAQVWAEVLTLYRAGETNYLSAEMERAAREIQEGHTEGNAKQGLIEVYLDTLLPPDWADLGLPERRDWLQGEGLEAKPKGTVPRTKVCINEILAECLGCNLAKVQPFERREVVGIMQRLKSWKSTGNIAWFGNTYGRQKCYERC